MTLDQFMMPPRCKGEQKRPLHHSDNKQTTVVMMAMDIHTNSMHLKEGLFAMYNTSSINHKMGWLTWIIITMMMMMIMMLMRSTLDLILMANGNGNRSGDVNVDKGIVELCCMLYNRDEIVWTIITI